MQILFYIEPHPIRNSFISFFGAAAQFSRILKQAAASQSSPVTYRIYANRKTIDELVAAIPEVKPFVLASTDAEERIFSAHMRDWMNGGIEEWCKLLVGEGEITTDYNAVINRIYQRFKFDVIVHWGDNGAVKAFVDDFPCDRVAMELGCTRKPYINSIYFDPLGTNGSALPAQIDLNDLQVIVTEPGWPAGADLLAYSDTAETMAYETMFIRPSFPGIGRLHSRKSQPAVYIPLQLHDDANLLIYSDFESPANVVDSIATQFADHGFLCVIKPHPSALSRPGGKMAYEAAHKAAKKLRDRVIWLDLESPPVPNSQLYALTDAVATVNSSVGFEALYHDKVVAVVGKSVYKPSGLFPTIGEICTSSFDENDYHRKTSILRRFFLTSYLVPEDQAFSQDSFLQRVTVIKALAEQAGSEPKRQLQQLYNRFAPEVVEERLDSAMTGITSNANAASRPWLDGPVSDANAATSIDPEDRPSSRTQPAK